MHDSRLVVGAGGTGKTHQLRSWADDDRAGGDRSSWVSGSPLQPVTEAQISDALSDPVATVVVDDLQWFDADALRALLAVAAERRVLASRRPGRYPEPMAGLIDAMDEALGREQPIGRLGLLDLDRFAAVLSSIRAELDPDDRAGSAMASDEVTAIHHLSGGSPAFATDLLSVRWDRSRVDPPEELVDAVLRRVRRAGDGARRLLELVAVARSIEPDADDLIGLAVRTVSADADDGQAERDARSGGLLGADGQAIPLVERALRADLTLTERGRLCDRLGGALSANEPLRAARYIEAGTGSHPEGMAILVGAALRLGTTDPEAAASMIDRAAALGLPRSDAALMRAVGSFQHGGRETLAHLDEALQAMEHPDERAAALGYGVDLRELRFASAAARPLEGELAAPLAQLANSFTGRLSTASNTPPTTPVGQVVTTMATAVDLLANGEIGDAVASCTAAADDFDRLQTSVPLGVTPHALGGLIGLAGGDFRACDVLTRQGIEARSGGRGERLSCELIGAYGALVTGDYRPAIDALRAHATAEPEAAADGAPAGERGINQRDRLLLAGIEAAIARRSGDTTRLRTAWARAEEALFRPSASWLLLDFFTELLSCGARLGDHDRVAPVVESLVAQGTGLPIAGPGPIGAGWLELQVAIAADDGQEVAAVAAAMAASPAVDRRSRARQEAATAWATIFARNAREDEVTAVAATLSAAGEGWEASRLLGQAALDENDPQAARRLLELARVATSDQIDEAGESGLAGLGLSEREAEVAVLVGEGRTHKEIGAQLFISPKTVEHHVAKIRQKLGASSRADMLGLIREALQ